MSALPRQERTLSVMTTQHMDAVVTIENAAYWFPWTRGNFIDSLAAGYPARVLHDENLQMLGYFVAMFGVDEIHLLNITVAPAEEGRGYARYMLDQLVELCRQRAARHLWLEVRESNTRARALYQRYGFSQIGVRKGYYPAPDGREDAVVMNLDVYRKGPHAVE